MRAELLIDRPLILQARLAVRWQDHGRYRALRPSKVDRQAMAGAPALPPGIRLAWSWK